MINFPPFLPELGMNAGVYQPSPLKRLLADMRVTDRWRILPTAISAREVIVPDISFYQDDNSTTRKVDFAKMKAAGARGVIIRAGQGNYIDEDFVDFWRDAKAAGLPRGAYWFYDPRRSPSIQADLFAGLFANDPPELATTMDAEYPLSWGGAYAGPTPLREFMERLKLKLPNTQKEIYTGYYWWHDNVWNKTTTAELAYFKQFPLHLAWYANDAAYVKIPLPWTQAEFRWWQYTSTGNGALYGVESPGVDLNNFVQGGVDVYQETFHLSSTPPPTPGEPMTKYTATALGNDTRVRPDHNVNGTYLGNYSAGVKFNGDVLFVATAPTIPNQNVGDKWLQITDINGVPKTGWVAITHLGKPICSLVENVPPSTTEPSIFMTHTFTDDLIVTKPDGTIQAYGATFTIYDVEYKPKP